ncbi:MAG: hypothetical protein ACRDEA_07770 [Microcystaceae cyanobacterium]
MLSTNGLILKQDLETLGNLIPLAVQHPPEIDLPELTPREFCRKMHGLADFPEIEILRAEMEPDYRRCCIELLGKVLRVKPSSVFTWGSNLDFPKMPARHKRLLGMCWERYELRLEIERLRRLTA